MLSELQACIHTFILRKYISIIAPSSPVIVSPPSDLVTWSRLEVRTLERGQNSRPEGGIEPLRFSAPTGLKPATRTTECHLDIFTLEMNWLYISHKSHGKKHDVQNGCMFIDIIKIILSGLRPEMGGPDPPMEAIHNGHCLRSKIHTMSWLT